MLPLFQKTLETYIKVLQIHFANKDKDPTFHEYLASLYESLFDFTHSIGEKLSDTEKPILTAKNEEFRQSVYDSIEELKKTYEEAVKKGGLSIGEDNLIRGLCDKLEFLCGNTRGFLYEMEDEQEEDKEKKEE